MKTLYFVLVVSVLLVCSASTAQIRSTAANTESTEAVPRNCEGNVFILNAAHVAANATGADASIIAIARLGDGERNRMLNHRRLHNVRVYLTEFGWHRDPATVITAEGERVKGYGRVELYVRGVSFESLAVRRNHDLLVGSCEPDDMRPVKAESNLYPFRDRRPRS
jgi:hypothetical protein